MTEFIAKYYWIGLIIAFIVGCVFSLLDLISHSQSMEQQLKATTDYLNELIEKLNDEDSKNTCPECNSPLSLMRSNNLKECTSCDYKCDWDLDPGQKPLIGSNRGDRRNGKKD